MDGTGGNTASAGELTRTDLTEPPGKEIGTEFVIAISSILLESGSSPLLQAKATCVFAVRRMHSLSSTL